MKISIDKNDSHLTYTLNDNSEQLSNHFSNHGYEQGNDGFIKRFPLPIVNIDQTIDNFRRFAPGLYHDLIDDQPMQWQAGLHQLATQLEKVNIPWWTNGKAALALLGVDVEVDDLDFVFDAQDLGRVQETLRDWIIEPIVETAGTFREHAVRYYGAVYAHCRICLMVDPLPALDVPHPVHFGQYARCHTDVVRWRGHDIQVAPLQLHLDTYSRWGVEDMVRRIRQTMQSQ